NIDRFHFVYQPLSGDGTIVARVVSVTGPSPVAGLMIREGLDSTAKQVALGTACSGSSYVTAVWRSTPGVYTTPHVIGVLPTSCWLKLTRSGDVFTMSYSADGVTWPTYYTYSQTVSMAQNVYIGLVMNSGLNSPQTLGTATFDNVSITGGLQPL